MKEIITDGCASQSPNAKILPVHVVVASPKHSSENDNNIAKEDVVVVPENEKNKDQNKNNTVERLFSAGVRPAELCTGLAKAYHPDRISQVVAAATSHANRNVGGWIVKALREQWILPKPASPSPAQVCFAKVKEDFKQATRVPSAWDAAWNRLSSQERSRHLERLGTKYTGNMVVVAVIGQCLAGKLPRQWMLEEMLSKNFSAA